MIFLAFTCVVDASSYRPRILKICIHLIEFSDEKHAELCYTECLFLDALLTFIQVINWFSTFLVVCEIFS